MDFLRLRLQHELPHVNTIPEMTALAVAVASARHINPEGTVLSLGLFPNKVAKKNW